MTRRDFELIASIIRTFRPSAPIPESILAEYRADLAGHAAASLRIANPRFDPDRFITAATTGGN